MTTEPATDKQTNNWPKIVFETVYFSFEKKHVLIRLEPRTFAVRGIFVTSRLSLPGTPKIFEYLLKQGRVESRRPDESVDKIFYGKKVLYPVAIPLLIAG